MSITDTDCRRLMSLVAHELRSPGAVVAGYLRLLARHTGPGLTEAERKMIDEANKSCGRLLKIAQELSELSELSGSEGMAGGLQVPIFALCEEVVAAAASDGTNVSFSIGPEDKGTNVDGHAGRLKQALSLLVAVIARERGGNPMTVTGAVSRMSAPRAIIVFGDSHDAADLEAVVQQSETAFDRWRGGTGLSLPIAHRIVEAHQGGLWSLPGGSRGACALGLPIL